MPSPGPTTARGTRDPKRLARWTGGGFVVGSACFALASFASQWATASRPAIGVTFFAGSLVFTATSYLAYWQVVNLEHGPMGRMRHDRGRPASWEPRRIDWLASVVQLVGTVFFNISTFEGMKRGFDTRQTNLRVWAPDVFGSICFLVASELAFANVCGRWMSLRLGSRPRRIAGLNLVGSIAFGVAAVTAVVEPSTNEPLSAAIANAGTTAGALCFLAGGLLMA